MDKQKIPFEQVRVIVDSLIERLSLSCVRLEPAGSYRRNAPYIGDIELVAIPKPVTDMFGAEIPITTEHALDRVDWAAFGKFIKGKHKYKQIELKEGINLDLFIVLPPAQWGTTMLIRTGPDDYSHQLVTSKQGFAKLKDGRRVPGLMPSNLKEHDGAIWHGLTLIETPEERDVYKLLGLRWLAPELRTA